MDFSSFSRRFVRFRRNDLPLGGRVRPGRGRSARTGLDPGGRGLEPGQEAEHGVVAHRQLAPLTAVRTHLQGQDPGLGGQRDRLDGVGVTGLEDADQAAREDLPRPKRERRIPPTSSGTTRFPGRRFPAGSPVSERARRARTVQHSSRVPSESRLQRAAPRRPVGAERQGSDADDLENLVFVPYDKLFADGKGTHKVGTVTAIEEPGKGQSGFVVLQDGEKVPYDALALAPGTLWSGPLNFPSDDASAKASIREWRRRYADAKEVVLVGGGAVGIGE